MTWSLPKQRVSWRISSRCRGSSPYPTRRKSHSMRIDWRWGREYSRQQTIFEGPERLGAPGPPAFTVGCSVHRLRLAALAVGLSSSQRPNSRITPCGGGGALICYSRAERGSVRWPPSRRFRHLRERALRSGSCGNGRRKEKIHGL